MKNHNANLKMQPRKSSFSLVALILLISIAPIFGAVESSRSDSPARSIFNSSDGFFADLFDLSSNRFLPFSLFSPQSVFVVNTTGDQSDQIPGDGFCNDGAGNCSLRAAIQEANAFAGAQTIDFNLPGSCGDSSILLNSPLPDITDSVTIDGYSNLGALTNTAQTGDNANLCVLLDGSSAGDNVDGLRIAAANTKIRGLVILNFSDSGIEVNAAGGIIEGNFIGTNRSGTGFFPNRIGISVSANNSRIGGATLPARNIISANTRFGISLNQAGSGGTIQNNYIGLDSNSAALGNGETGVNVFRSSNNLIGGATAAMRNIISANGRTATGGLDGSGIYIFGDQNLGQAPNNTIQGNYIGTNPAGTSAIANKTDGILINGAINSTIAGNVASGNMIDGIGITGAGATGNIVKGNTVGLDVNRANNLGNARDGVSIFQVGGNTVGGTGGDDGNWIGGNARYGAFISGTGGENNSVLGNFIGFNINNAARPQTVGVVIFTSNNTVGGTTAAARNYVAGNTDIGVFVGFSSGNTVSGNYVGLTNTGAVLGSTIGVSVQDATNNTIGGTASGAGNVVSGNSRGVRLLRSNPGSPTTDNQILGNLIGTSPDGMSAQGNAYGIATFNANNNIIGGTTAAARNIISGNTLYGINIEQSANNQVIGNYIGTKADGLTALPNQVGISLYQTPTTGNVIGGTATGAGNVISGNGSDGIQIFNNASANSIQGNIIGLKADGSAALPNTNGITITATTFSNVIGGTAANSGNVISGNSQSGLVITGGANNNSVQGNKIGTDATGMIDFGNLLRGIDVTAGGAGSGATINNLIGGTTAAARNIISANKTGGVYIDGATTTGNQIQGNYIGTKADGISALGNTLYGILITAPNNTVGGATAAHRNVVSGQSGITSMGISVSGSATNTLVQNNYIGTTADGSGSLPNYFGIYCAITGNFTFDSNLISSNTFGITFDTVNGGKIINNVFGLNAAGNAALGNSTAISIYAGRNISIGSDNGSPAPNVIANSLQNGIEILQTVSKGNTISRNSIYNSGQLGIDLMKDGVTQNDTQDADDGPNHLQNFPVINNATTTISGSLNSTPSRTFRLEFFSSPSANVSGYGEGKTYLTSQDVTTDGSGNAVFSVSNPQPLGSYISATATDLTTSETSEFSAYKQTLAPTAVQFAGATTKAFDNGALIEWQTGLESDNLGFNIYRERGGKRELVNQTIIAGSALMTDAQLLSGQNYSWFDREGDSQAAYFIEAIDLNGTKDVYGSFSAEKVSGIAPARFDSTTLDSLGETNNQTVEVAPKAAALKPTTAQVDVQNILANTAGVKLSIKQAGFYRVTAEQLLAGGLPVDANFANLRMFADGIEQPINVLTENGAFTGVEFYGIGADTSETATRIYYLAASDNAGLRLTKFSETRPASSANSFLSTVERRDRTVYFSGLLNGDAENFFGAVITSSTGTNQTLNLANIAASNETAKLEISLQGVTRTAHNVRVELNGSFVTTVAFSEMERGSATVSVPSNSLREGENTIRLTPDNAGDVSLVDAIRLTYPRRLNASGNALTLTADGERESTVRGFTTQNVRVFDVTDQNAPFELEARIRPDVKDGSIEQSAKIANARTEIEKQSDDGDADRTSVGRGYSATFAAVGSGKRNLIAVSNALSPVAVEANRASNLRDRRNAASLIIITRRDLAAALEPLANLRRSQGLTVRIVDIADIYDEFSFGRKSSQSIRDFLQFATKNWLKKPQFVILAGDGTYDPKGYVFGDGADVVQTKLVDAENMETASDEWLTDFDNDGVGELAIGRLPAQNVGEMNAIVGKLLNYDTQPVANSAAFVADASDGFDFAAGNGSVRALYPQTMNFAEINRAADDTTTAKIALLNAINGGQRIVNYAGHGSSTIWRGNLLTTTDANNLHNGDRLPMFVTMSCLNGYFTNAGTESLSEALLKNPNGGAIAVWASTGTTQPDSQTELNRAFARALFDGSQPTIGQAVQIAKRNVGNVSIRRTWTLFGDPTMRLR